MVNSLLGEVRVKLDKNLENSSISNRKKTFIVFLKVFFVRPTRRDETVDALYVHICPTSRTVTLRFRVYRLSKKKPGSPRDERPQRCKAHVKCVYLQGLYHYSRHARTSHCAYRARALSTFSVATLSRSPTRSAQEASTLSTLSTSRRLRRKFAYVARFVQCSS